MRPGDRMNLIREAYENLRAVPLGGPAFITALDALIEQTATLAFETAPSESEPFNAADPFVYIEVGEGLYIVRKEQA